MPFRVCQQTAGLKCGEQRRIVHPSR